MATKDWFEKIKPLGNWNVSIDTKDEKVYDSSLNFDDGMHAYSIGIWLRLKRLENNKFSINIDGDTDVTEILEHYKIPAKGKIVNGGKNIFRLATRIIREYKTKKALRELNTDEVTC
jgi:hypothetical protein